MPEDVGAKLGKRPGTVDFHYIKSNSYRVMAIDGVLGHLTPSGRLFLALYSERAAIPQVITQSISEDGDLGEIVDIEGRTGFVREVEAGVVLDLASAERLRDFLNVRISELTATAEQSEKGINT